MALRTQVKTTEVCRIFSSKVKKKGYGSNRYILSVNRNPSAHCRAMISANSDLQRADSWEGTLVLPEKNWATHVETIVFMNRVETDGYKIFRK